jgi:hypothetical protein
MMDKNNNVAKRALYYRRRDKREHQTTSVTTTGKAKPVRRKSFCPLKLRIPKTIGKQLAQSKVAKTMLISPQMHQKTKNPKEKIGKMCDAPFHPFWAHKRG